MGGLAEGISRSDSRFCLLQRQDIATYFGGTPTKSKIGIKLGRGQDVFYRYGGAALTGLAYQSLLGGMGAARVTEVLARTGGFSTKLTSLGSLELHKSAISANGHLIKL
ncbi:hypothetical protein DID88_005723 [Monilinia fructigena]|uniref:Uncharacterized protein n=1 Tax=Monilinia fructigena TaxID=38457 RepID=A0A395J2Y9_9HELO|nr:hypothetical protein DID88_005723 [Monilinia fructigena]